MERMVEVVLGSDYQAIQQFISNSRGSARAVTNRVAQDADARIGDEKDSFLLLDETGFPKKGKNLEEFLSQWLGCLGKGDIGQGGVFIALYNGNDVTPPSESNG
jgi:SRSO17 transposase